MNEINFQQKNQYFLGLNYCMKYFMHLKIFISHVLTLKILSDSSVYISL